MGQASNRAKERKCQVCEQFFYLTAKQLQEHTSLCKRAKRSGLVLPGTERPKVKIIRLDE